jgi:gluconokinase
MIIVVMGVEGVGKTTIGRRLAQELGWLFVEGDDFHPAANVEKMHRGEPLTDADRAPWLQALRQRIDALVAAGQSAVVGASALKQAYRDVLASGRPEVRFVYLKGSADVLRERLARRRGHFMPPALLTSQLETLEEPTGALTVDVTPAPDELVATIRRALAV